MKYPNLTAEFETVTGTDLKLLSRDVNVTEGAMHDVLYGDECLTWEEALAAHRALSWCDDSNGGLSRFSLEYLFSPKLGMLDPRKGKTWNRYKLLERKYLEAKKVMPYTNSWVYGPILQSAHAVYLDMGHHKPVKYADYRRAVTTLDNYIAFYSEQREERKKAPRSERLEKAV